MLNFGPKSNASSVVSFNVTEPGYYCVGVVSSNFIYESRSRSKKFGSFEGYAEFHNVFSGTLPSTMYPLLRFYGIAIICLLAMLGGWIILLRSSAIDKPEMIIEAGSQLRFIALLWLLDACSRWLSLSFLNSQRVDFHVLKVLPGALWHTMGVKVAFFVLASFSALRDGIAFMVLFNYIKRYGFHSNAKTFTSQMFAKICGWYGLSNALYALDILWDYLDLNGAWVIPRFPLAFTHFFITLIASFCLIDSQKYYAKQHQTYKGGVFFSIKFADDGLCSFWYAIHYYDWDVSRAKKGLCTSLGTILDFERRCTPNQSHYWYVISPNSYSASLLHVPIATYEI